MITLQHAPDADLTAPVTGESVFDSPQTLANVPTAQLQLEIRRRVIRESLSRLRALLQADHLVPGSTDGETMNLTGILRLQLRELVDGTEDQADKAELLLTEQEVGRLARRAGTMKRVLPPQKEEKKE